MRKKFLVATVLFLLLIIFSSGTVFADDVYIANTAELEAAISGQTAGDVWHIANGTYDISRNYSIWAGNPGSETQGWYFPIVVDNLTISGESRSGVIITSTESSANGAWATQDFIAVFGDGVTIENVTLQGKMDANKTVEVMGLDFTFRNSTIDNIPGDPYGGWSGSLYFNGSQHGGDVGNVLIQDVLIKDAFISAVPPSSGYSWYVDQGPITLDNVVIDVRSGTFSDWNWGVISDNKPVFSNSGNGLIIYIDENYASVNDVQAQIIDRAPAGSTIVLPDGSYGGDLSVFNTSGGQLVMYQADLDPEPATVTNPQTGYKTNLFVYFLTAAVLLMGSIFAVITIRKKSNT